jgi:hypothetical protein
MSNFNPTIPKCTEIEGQYKDMRKKHMNDLFKLRVKLNGEELGEEERIEILNQIKVARAGIVEATKLSLQEVKNRNNELGGMKK